MQLVADQTVTTESNLIDTLLYSAILSSVKCELPTHLSVPWIRCINWTTTFRCYYKVTYRKMWGHWPQTRKMWASHSTYMPNDKSRWYLQSVNARKGFSAIWSTQINTGKLESKKCQVKVKNSLVYCTSNMKKMQLHFLNIYELPCFWAETVSWKTCC